MTTLHESLVADAMAAVGCVTALTPSDRLRLTALLVAATAPYAERVTRLEAELKEARATSETLREAIGHECRTSDGDWADLSGPGALGRLRAALRSTEPRS
jgi:hypothetical protein